MNGNNQISIIMSHTSNRGTAAQTENKNRVNNRNSRSRKGTQQQSQVPACNAAVPAKVEDLEARLKGYDSDLSKAKKSFQKQGENLAKAKDIYTEQRYVVAVSRANNGTASAEDLQIIASRKASDFASMLIAKAMGVEFKDSDEVANARSLAKSEEGSMTSAIAETERCWNTKGYATLYGSIGLSKRHLKLIPTLLKGLCPFLLVATADGLKAANLTRTAVRKNGKAVKKDGKRVYKYTLRQRTKWTAYGLFETLELNYRWMENNLFTEDELKTRFDLLEAEVSALKALKATKDAQTSDDPYKAANAASRLEDVQAAANAASQLTAANLQEVSTESKMTTRRRRTKKTA